MHRHTPRSRDAALRRLASSNRWLIGASAALAGVFTAVAANAFPGRTVKVGTAASSTSKLSGGSTSRRSRAHALRPPSEAPEASEAVESEVGEGEEAVPVEESFESESAAPEGEEPIEEAPERKIEQEAVREPEPEPEVQAPVISGGS